MNDALARTIDEVRSYYDRRPQQEWQRLVRQRLEYAVTLRALRDTLPATARVLDAGGGPGRYAVALAAAGHAVTLLDLSPRLLQLARDHAAQRKVHLAGIGEGSATDLCRFDDASFEAVLLLGPLYHLPELEDRLLALREARRVLVPDGVLVVAFVSRYAPLRQLAQSDPESLLRLAERYEALLERGVLPGADERDEPVQGYYARPDEIAPLMERAGFETPRLLAVEGLLDGIERRVAALRGAAWNAWADLIYDLAGEQGVLASSTHILAIAQRNEDDGGRA